jgi:hypothetical protein
VLPVFIFVAVAIPVLLIAFVTVKARKREGEHTPGEDAAEIEAEFAEAERYQAEWREEQHRS